MSMITNYVDVSTKSLVIAVVVFLIVTVITKYGLDSYSLDVKEEEKRSFYITMIYSIIVGLLFGLLSLVLFKQFCKFGTCDILTDPFPRAI
jgi:FtsH-binding integral membrane protein